MRPGILRKALQLGVLLAAASSMSAANAQAYPSKPIRLILTAAPSQVDTVARLVSPRLAERLGQPVVVENRAGAGGNVAVAAAVRAQPDGYTFLITPNIIAIAPLVSKDVTYDPIKDLAAVGRLSFSLFGLVVNAASPAHTIDEFIKLAKANPGQLNYGSPGRGTPQHLTMEYIKQAKGLYIVPIPYPQSPQAVVDLTAGRIDAMVIGVSQILPLVQSGKLRLLAINGDKRSPDLPGVPAIREAGIEALDNPWHGMLAPAGTPADIIERLNKEVTLIMNSREVQEALARQQITVSTSTPSEFAAQLRTDLERWRKVVAVAGITRE